MGLAAETAADLRRGDAQLRGFHAEQLRAVLAVDEMPLRADPEVGGAVGAHARHAGMRLDIALVRLLGLEGAFDDEIGLPETLIDVAMAVLGALGDVGRLGGLFLEALGEDGVVEHGRGALHRLVDIGHMRQHLVIDLDELQRLPGRAGVDGGDRGHRMAVIERLLARHAVVEDVVHGGIAIGEVGQVGRGDHRLHAVKLLRLRGVDLPDRRVGVRASEDAPDQLAGHVEVRAVAGAARHLVDAVGADRTRADRCEVASRITRIEIHRHAPFITLAASWTARTILS